MKVILKEDVNKLGSSGEIVSVKPGFARNFLFPRELAVLANEKNVRNLEHNKRVINAHRNKIISDASSLKDKIEALDFNFIKTVGLQGKLFGSVTAKDISLFLKDNGIELDRHSIDLKDAIKETGEFPVSFKLHKEVIAEVSIKVLADAESEEAQATS